MICPDCGSTNTTGPDETGLWDCRNCGIWFDPLHPKVQEDQGMWPKIGAVGRAIKVWLQRRKIKDVELW